MVWISYSPECVLLFPYTQDNNKLIVYWDNNIDTKYNFDIVKAINKTDRKIIGRPFLILELKNDRTLRATYPKHPGYEPNSFIPASTHFLQFPPACLE